MGFKLVRTDCEDPSKIALPLGLHPFGRGVFLDCEDKRVSRKHGMLDISIDTVKLRALHHNPCFYKKKGASDITIIHQGDVVDLCNGDTFGLLPSHFWYELIHSSSPPVSPSPNKRKERTPKKHTPTKICSNSPKSKKSPENEEAPFSEVKLALESVQNSAIVGSPATAQRFEDSPSDSTQNIDSSFQCANHSPLLDFHINESFNERAESPSLLPEHNSDNPDLSETHNYQMDSQPSPSKRLLAPEDSEHVEEKRIKTEPQQDLDLDNQPGPSASDIKPKVEPPAAAAAAASPVKPEPDRAAGAGSVTPKERCWYGAQCYRDDITIKALIYAQETRYRNMVESMKLLELKSVENEVFFYGSGDMPEDTQANPIITVNSMLDAKSDNEDYEPTNKNLAVIVTSQPRILFTIEQGRDLKHALTQSLINYLLDPKRKGPSPQFRRHLVDKKGLKLWCIDDDSAEWLTKAVKDIPSPFEHAVLVVEIQSEVCHCVFVNNAEDLYNDPSNESVLDEEAYSQKDANELNKYENTQVQINEQKESDLGSDIYHDCTKQSALDDAVTQACVISELLPQIQSVVAINLEESNTLNQTPPNNTGTVIDGVTKEKQKIYKENATVDRNYFAVALISATKKDLTPEQLRTLKDALCKQFVNDFYTLTGFVPSYCFVKYPAIVGCAILMTCENKSTLEWLYHIVTTCSPFQDAKVRIVPQEELKIKQVNSTAQGDSLQLSDLEVAVTTDRPRHFTLQQARKIHQAITDQMNTFGLQFIKAAYVKDGAIMCFCMNDDSRRWLEHAVANITSPYKNTKLILVKQTEVDALVKAAIKLPKFCKAKQIPAILEAQNPRYNIRDWKFYCVVYRKGRYEYTVGIPQAESRKVQKPWRFIYFVLGSVRVQYHTHTGKLSSVPFVPSPAVHHLRNPQHLSRFAHPGEAAWGAGERGECPRGAACRLTHPRHWDTHTHPPGTLPPPPPGARVLERRGNVYYINAHAVHFHDDHLRIEDEDGDSVDYDYEF